MSDAWREVVAERKARTVKDTGYALWPDRTLVREWPNVPTSIRDECRDNLLTFASAVNLTAQKWITAPLSDNQAFPGDWRCIAVEVVDVPDRGFSVRQTLGLGMYRTALPDPFLVNAEDKYKTPFDEVTVTESQRLIEYRNIHPDYSETLKPSLGPYTNFWGNSAEIINVEIKKNEDGSHSIFVLEGEVSGTGTTVETGEGLQGSVQWPECPAKQERRIFKDVPVANVEAAITTLSVSPDGYIVSAVLRGDERGGFVDLVQILEKKTDFVVSGGFLITQDDPLTDVEKRVVIWPNVSKGDEDTIRDTLESVPAFSGYAVMKVDFNYRGECKMDALQYLEKSYTISQFRLEVSKDLVDVSEPYTDNVYTYEHRNIKESAVDDAMSDLIGEDRTISVTKKYRGPISDLIHRRGQVRSDYALVKVLFRKVQVKAVTTNTTFDEITRIQTFSVSQKVTLTINNKHYDTYEEAQNFTLNFTPANEYDSCNAIRLGDGSWLVEATTSDIEDLSSKVIGDERFD